MGAVTIRSPAGVGVVIVRRGADVRVVNVGRGPAVVLVVARRRAVPAAVEAAVAVVAVVRVLRVRRVRVRAVGLVCVALAVRSVAFDAPRVLGLAGKLAAVACSLGLLCLLLDDGLLDGFDCLYVLHVLLNGLSRLEQRHRAAHIAGGRTRARAAPLHGGEGARRRREDGGLERLHRLAQVARLLEAQAELVKHGRGWRGRARGLRLLDALAQAFDGGEGGLARATPVRGAVVRRVQA
mmetsp:Transcript_33977/g.58333  ORF Transcript_33977/g.58333 Transcript_33977/m.58333 type:complete len:238 (-) Transcript_33977:274-987(-)